MIRRTYPFLSTQAVGLTLFMAGMLLVLFQNVQAQGTIAGGEGQASSPAAPQSRILDDADLFREHPEAFAEVQASLLRMEQKFAYPVYLAICYSVYDGNLQGRADTLHQAWIGESSRGMMIVYQLDPVVSGNNPAIAFYKGSDLDSEISADPKSQLIAGRQIEAMLSRVVSQMKETRENDIPFLIEFVQGVEGEIAKYHEVKPTSWSDQENLNLMGVFLGAIVVLTLLGVILWKLFSRADAKSNKQHFFPEVKVGRRLDAPYGGGWVSEKTFLPASSRR